ncbi:hypothetical protein FOXG_17470 [Fusarium oxysporum f. sp. lycopersici 4287]|uniref:Uncharacterized protein n=2 Tax=Fusarium oxysporum TaxID=5507 RepID=A0A0J9WCG3_FUSO4|nr:uncharacterized protein FOXG_17470 [Fusarium oxysporum f. sp. lycopersici 4287]KNB20558.1 hypothetical protein FOXG_17470 [Fusarium oxysporum f. sp. lycopersici 4287]
MAAKEVVEIVVVSYLSRSAMLSVVMCSIVRLKIRSVNIGSRPLCNGLLEGQFLQGFLSSATRAWSAKLRPFGGGIVRFGLEIWLEKHIHGRPGNNSDSAEMLAG